MGIRENAFLFIVSIMKGLLDTRGPTVLFLRCILR